MTSHLEAPGDTDVERKYLFQFVPLQNEWEVCSTADDHEIVCAKGFDDGFRALASWVLEREASSRFGIDGKWITAQSEDGPVRAYGPAEHLLGRVDEEVQRLVEAARTVASAAGAAGTMPVNTVHFHRLRAALEPFQATSPTADAEHRWYEPTPEHRISRCETCGCWEDEESAERPCAVSPTTVEEGRSDA